MDPPLISEASFSTANPSLAEIWPFGGGGRGGGTIGDMNGLLGLRMGSGGDGGGGFGRSLMSAFLDAAGGDVMVHRDGSIEESSVTEQSESLGGGGGRKRRAMALEDESSKLFSATATTTANSGSELKEHVGKQMKLLGSKDENGVSKSGPEASSAGGGKTSEKNNKLTEPPKDYIHVRARRGQATDSHSLAERARREKISERMKLLQDLVPGCNKVIGKALVLDEIINYIQSLQRQVEFLSMKLEAINSGINPAINGFPSKDPGQPTFDTTGMMFTSQAGREYAPIMDTTEWLHMHLGGGGFERTT